MKLDAPKGWGMPVQSRKFHYFDNNSMALCGKWGFYFGDAEDTNDAHADNCAACKKLVGTVRKREASQMTDAHAQAAKRVADAALAMKIHAVEHDFCYTYFCTKRGQLEREFHAALTCYSAFAEPVTSDLENENG